MAKVWFAYEGDSPTQGDATAELPLARCVQALQLSQDRYLGDDPKKVRFGEPNEPLAKIRGYQHVVVEVEKHEAKNGWKVGYYYSPLKPEEAAKLIRSQ